MNNKATSVEEAAALLGTTLTVLHGHCRRNGGGSGNLGTVGPDSSTSKNGGGRNKLLSPKPSLGVIASSNTTSTSATGNSSSSTSKKINNLGSSSHSLGDHYAVKAPSPKSGLHSSFASVQPVPCAELFIRLRDLRDLLAIEYRTSMRIIM